MSSQLTEAQIHAIVESWKIPSSIPIDAGEIILFKFLEKYPDNQQKFAKFKNKPLSELKGTPAFRAHASRVMNAFCTTVDCLQLPGGWDELPIIWREIGENHERRKISKASFEELREIIVSVLIDVCKLTPEQQEAWTILLNYIYEAALSCIST
ncbi:globin CTT-VIIB-7-like [Culicoides brevitarsis]|uniref:globin CTT-VIIB-7-like n=1 Tax=Culicoides brevitarsis TaxID=469753 RepID=UPI00307BF684